MSEALSPRNAAIPSPIESVAIASHPPDACLRLHLHLPPLPSRPVTHPWPWIDAAPGTNDGAPLNALAPPPSKSVSHATCSLRVPPPSPFALVGSSPIFRSAGFVPVHLHRRWSDMHSIAQLHIGVICAEEITYSDPPCLFSRLRGRVGVNSEVRAWMRVRIGHGYVATGACIPGMLPLSVYLTLLSCAIDAVAPCSRRQVPASSPSLLDRLKLLSASYPAVRALDKSKSPFAPSQLFVCKQPPAPHLHPARPCLLLLLRRHSRMHPLRYPLLLFIDCSFALRDDLSRSDPRGSSSAHQLLVLSSLSFVVEPRCLLLGAGSVYLWTIAANMSSSVLPDFQDVTPLRSSAAAVAVSRGICAVENRPQGATPLPSSAVAVAVSRGICAVENRPQGATPLRSSPVAVAVSRGICAVENCPQGATPLCSSAAVVAASRAIFAVENCLQLRIPRISSIP
ncbi:hypothetical protein C8R45DRAFT_1102112 [Mycena sanguinolenta]|nr:hypothetical protein C8R45DRAFT_1102112 [Mycena sanguinolenta]